MPDTIQASRPLHVCHIPHRTKAQALIWPAFASIFASTL